MSSAETNRYFLPIDSDQLMPQANGGLEEILQYIQEHGLKSRAGIATPDRLPVRALVRMLDEPQHLRQPDKPIAGPYIDMASEPPRLLGGLMLYRVVKQQ